MLSQLWPDSKAEKKRAPKTPAYFKARRPKRSKTMSKEECAKTKLSPTEIRIFELMKAWAMGSVFSGRQADIAKKLSVHPQTVKVAMNRLIAKRYIARSCSNVYMLNPERSSPRPTSP